MKSEKLKESDEDFGKKIVRLSGGSWGRY